MPNLPLMFHVKSHCSNRSGTLQTLYTLVTAAVCIWRGALHGILSERT